MNPDRQKKRISLLTALLAGFVIVSIVAASIAGLGAGQAKTSNESQTTQGIAAKGTESTVGSTSGTPTSLETQKQVLATDMPPTAVTTIKPTTVKPTTSATTPNPTTVAPTTKATTKATTAAPTTKTTTAAPTTKATTRTTTVDVVAKPSPKR